MYPTHSVGNMSTSLANGVGVGNAGGTGGFVLPQENMALHGGPKVKKFLNASRIDVFFFVEKVTVGAHPVGSNGPS